MGWTFQGITTLNSALEAFQTQLEVTSQNIANVDTPGYSEEQVNLAEAPSSSVTEGAISQLGNGVSVQSVTRIQDTYLQGSRYASNANLGMANEQANTASGVSGVIQSVGGQGLSSDLSAFFNAWSGLASNPSSSEQLAVQQAGQTVANDVQSMATGFGQLQQSNTQQIQAALQQVQSDVNQIAGLNQQILKSQAQGGTPNALLDQRDELVSNLSSMMNVNVQNSSDGSVVITSGNLDLVDQTGAHTIPTTYNAATSSLTNGSTSYSIQSGTLAGLFDSANKLTSYQSNLDTFATTLTSQVNAIYSTAADASGNTGESFFTDTGGAAGFSLSSNIANNAGAILTGTSGSASDTGVAQSIANLVNAPVSSLGGNTMSGYYSNMLGQIGVDGQNANNAQSTQQAINQQVQAQISSVTGVNLDDEMTSLLQFQRSYQAAAQALNIMDQTTASFLSTVQG